MCFLLDGGLPGARLLYRGSDRGRRAASGARSRKLDCSRGGRTGRSALDGTRKRRFVGVRCPLESGRRAEDDARRVQLSGRRRTGQRNRIRFFRDRRVCRRPALGFRLGQGRSACRTLARGGCERDLYQQRDRSARRRYGSRRSRLSNSLITGRPTAAIGTAKAGYGIRFRAGDVAERKPGLFLRRLPRTVFASSRRPFIGRPARP